MNSKQVDLQERVGSGGDLGGVEGGREGELWSGCIVWKKNLFSIKKWWNEVSYNKYVVKTSKQTNNKDTKAVIWSK